MAEAIPEDPYSLKTVLTNPNEYPYHETGLVIVSISDGIDAPIIIGDVIFPQGLFWGYVICTKNGTEERADIAEVDLDKVSVRLN